MSEIKKDMRIVFMGTPDFAVPSLKLLVENGYQVVAVVTVPDKPAGRGYQLQESAVKKAANLYGLKVLQPEKLKAKSFIQELNNLQVDVMVVVAFRKLPDMVWKLPKFGTFNLHGSILPDYRGAAPLNWAVMNGEKETGVTTFFIDEKIDTGKVIFTSKIPIHGNDTVGQIHDTLMMVGADLVLKTVKAIESNNVQAVPQETLLNGRLPKEAPKIFKETCLINWAHSAEKIHNQIRGLSPYPTAFSTLNFPDGKSMSVKIFLSEKSADSIEMGKIKTDQKTYIQVGCGTNSVSILQLQPEGKKRMSVEVFLRGRNVEGCYFSL